MPQDRLDPVLRFDPKDPGSKSMTQQQFRDECDINVIMKRYERSGTLPEGISGAQPQFGDFSDVPDFQTIQNTVVAVQMAFNRLPASTRARFDHSPQKALDFLSNSENTPEAFKLGMISQEDFDNYEKAKTPKADSQAPAGAQPTGEVTP